MGRGRSLPIARASAAQLPDRPAPVLRVLDVLLGTVALLLALPLLVLVGVAVRCSSHGPLFERELVVGRDGRRAQLLSFRTCVDGGRTEAHERLRAVIGGGHAVPFTPAGATLRRLRLDRLPRLVNVVAGDLSFFA
jgi:lipopolysaccharide/colanic/teichoic acid biosynthesis glycosyltransferase